VRVQWGAVVCDTLKGFETRVMSDTLVEITPVAARFSGGCLGDWHVREERVSAPVPRSGRFLLRVVGRDRTFEQQVAVARPAVRERHAVHVEDRQTGANISGVYAAFVDTPYPGVYGDTLARGLTDAHGDADLQVPCGGLTRSYELIVGKAGGNWTRFLFHDVPCGTPRRTMVTL
jgi:hypothetical protein